MRDRGIEQCLNFLLGQVGNQARVGLLERYRQDPTDLLESGWVAIFQKAEERSDGRQPNIARIWGVSARLLEIFEKRTDQGGVELLQC